MSKSPKTDRLREMREAKHAQTQSPKATTGERVIKALKEAVEAAQGKREPAASTVIKVDALKAAAVKGGNSKSPAKQSASRQNGKKGGRPRKTQA